MPSALVQQAAQQQTKLVSDLLRNVEELQKLKSDITAIRKERADIMYECREAMSELQMKRDDDKVDQLDQNSTERWEIDIIFYVISDHYFI